MVQIKDLLTHVLGLTPNESTIYSILLEIGQATANDIKDKSGFPLSRVYGIAQKLEKKGLIRRSKDALTVFHVLPPMDTIAEHIEKQREEFDKKLLQLEKLKGILQMAWEENISNEIASGIDVIRFEAVEHIFLQDVLSCRERLWVAAASERSYINWRYGGNALVKRFTTHTFDVKYLVTTEDVAQLLSKRFKNWLQTDKLPIQIKYNSNLKVPFFIVDSTLYLFLSEAVLSKDSFLIRTENKALVSQFEWIFLMLWKEQSA